MVRTDFDLFIGGMWFLLSGIIENIGVWWLGILLWGIIIGLLNWGGSGDLVISEWFGSFLGWI